MDGVGVERRADQRQGAGLGGIDFLRRHVCGGADCVEPCGRALHADWRAADHGAAGGFEFADRRRVERVRRGGDLAIQRGVEVAPLAGRQLRRDGQTHGRQQRADARRIAWEELADHRDSGRILLLAGAGDGALLGLGAGVFEHRAGQHVLGLGVGRHAEARHVDADDAHAVDLLRQAVQRHAGRGGDAQVDDHNRVVVRWLCGFIHRVADVLEQLALDQCFRVERHVPHGAACAIEVRGEGEAIHAAGGAAQDRRRAAHAQADAQRAEGRAH